jgi:hypothetical protein
LEEFIMSRSRKMPDLIAQLALVTFSTAILSNVPVSLMIVGLLGLASAVGLQAAGQSRDAAMMAKLRRLAEGLQSGRNWPRNCRI